MAEFNFEPNATGRSLTNALALARMSLLAYERDEAATRSTLEEQGFTQQKILDHEETQGFVAGSDGVVVVAFRGTEADQTKDLASDARLRMTAGPRGEVHRGFLAALDAVWDNVDAGQSVLRTVQEFSSGGQPIWVTGHSLGAGLATLATARLTLDNDIGVAGLYTFGSPRVGDEEFAEAFDNVMKERTFRFVNNNDVVTRVPLPGKLLPYRHIGQLQYFKESGELKDEIGWFEKTLDRLAGRMDDLFEAGTDGMKDHSMTEYVRLLEGVAAS